MLRYVLTLAFMLVAMSSVMAGDQVTPEMLSGEWTYAQRASNEIYVDTLVLNNGAEGLAGVMKYQDKGKEAQDVFGNFEFKSRRRVWFTSTRPNGRVVKHMAELSEDRNTLSGNYNLGFGVGGAFVATRKGIDGPPSMSAAWVYYVVDPEGGPGLYGDMTLLCDAGGNCKGYLMYRQGGGGPKITVEYIGGKQHFVMYKPVEQYSKTVACTVSKDKAVKLEIYGKEGTFTCAGKLAENGLRVDGIWENPKIGKGQFVLSRAK